MTIRPPLWKRISAMLIRVPLMGACVAAGAAIVVVVAIATPLAMLDDWASGVFDAERRWNSRKGSR